MYIYIYVCVSATACVCACQLSLPVGYVALAQRTATITNIAAPKTHNNESQKIHLRSDAICYTLTENNNTIKHPILKPSSPQ